MNPKNLSTNFFFQLTLDSSKTGMENYFHVVSFSPLIRGILLLLHFIHSMHIIQADPCTVSVIDTFVPALSFD
jgi:hypothetical protein